MAEFMIQLTPDEADFMKQNYCYPATYTYQINNRTKKETLYFLNHNLIYEYALRY